MNKPDCNSQCGDDAPEAIQQALKIIGDKWTALILRNLHAEPMRFTDIREQIIDINPRTLTQRLIMLEENSIIEKQHFDEPLSCSKYTLTDKGRGLDEVIHSMAIWGEKFASKEEVA